MSRYFGLFVIVFVLILSWGTGAQNSSKLEDPCENSILLDSSEDVIKEMASLYLSLFHSEKARAKKDLKSEELIWTEKLKKLVSKLPNAADAIRIEVEKSIRINEENVDHAIREHKKSNERQRQELDQRRGLLICSRTKQVQDLIVAAVNSNNPGAHKTCANITPEDLLQVKRINLEGKGIGELDEFDFYGLTALEEINLGYNNLQSLPEYIFRGLVSVKRIILNGNFLKTLPVGVFTDQLLLDQLIINFNPITSLEPGIFDGLKRLRILTLRSNSVSNLPKDIFKDQALLEELDLSLTQLSNFPEEALRPLSGLRVLEMDTNPFADVPGKYFQNWANLLKLTLPSQIADPLKSEIQDNLKHLDFEIEWR